MDYEKHLGLARGLHGKKLEDISPDTRQYIDSLVSAADKNGYALNRLSLNASPIRLIFVGEQYPDSRCNFEGLIKEAMRDGDKVFADNPTQKEILERTLKMPVGYSNFSLEDVRALMALHKVKCLPGEAYLDKILKTLQSELQKSDPHSRIYQQIDLDLALVNEHLRPKLWTEPHFIPMDGIKGSPLHFY